MIAAADYAIEDAKRIDIRAVASSLGVQLARGGRTAFCPLGHSRGPSGGSPSLSLSQKDGVGLWHCHSCSEGGSAIDLVMAVKGVEIREALEFLGHPLPVPPNLEPLPPPKPEIPYARRRLAVEAFTAELPPLDEFGLQWIKEHKGILPVVAERFGLRCIEERSGNAAMVAAIHATDAETAIALGLAQEGKGSGNLYCPRGYGYWIVIPYLDSHGHCGHLQFRRVHRSGDAVNAGDKWRHLGGVDVPYPFNVAALESDNPWFVEGAFDSMRLEQDGVPAVGLPGTGWLKRPDRMDATARRCKGRPVLALDADQPGRDATDRLLPEMQARGVRPMLIRWPAGWGADSDHKDWCDIFALDGGVPEVTDPDAVPLVTFATLLQEGGEKRVSEALGERVVVQHESGIRSLDEVLCVGAQDLVILGARPGGFKTHLMLGWLRHLGLNGKACGMVSCEMPRDGLAERIADAELNLNKRKLPDAGAIEMDLARAMEAWQTAHSVFIEFPGRELDVVADSVRRMAGNGAVLVGVDHAQHINVKRAKGIFDRLDAVGRMMDELCDELGIAIILGSQMARGTVGKEKAPTIDGLKGSGTLEEVADAVLLTKPDDRNVEMIVDKQRSGVQGTAACYLPKPFGWLVDAPPKLPGGRR